MILCLDCGNTRLKWALLTPAGEWHARGILPREQIGSLRAALIGQPSVKRTIGCNVSGEENAELIAAQLGTPPEWITPKRVQCGVKNGYTHPAQLGADRWVALIAAREQNAGACVVVNAGTATTIDMLAADGTFRGGLILPGLDLMRSALAKNTANLPLAHADYASIPTDTDTAIVSGVLEATVGAIERMHARLGDASAICLLSGGAADQIAPLLQMPLENVDDLVLRGLARIALSDN
ncbi:MAG TPA: type III pantothenate kinase [Rhodocyclaceae bacterium]|nr:type III pantothenate kinase [Rhodocyclaceae bacterium]